MKEGDIIEWRGVNKTHLGKVIRHESGELVCQMEHGKNYPLKAPRYANSAKLIQL